MLHWFPTIRSNLSGMFTRTSFRIFAGIALCLSLTPLSIAQRKAAPISIVITHGTVINPGTSSVRADQTVVITGDRITAVSDSAKFQLPESAGTRVIDA